MRPVGCLRWQRYVESERPLRESGRPRPGNQIRLVHGCDSRRPIPLTAEDEAEIDDLLALPHVIGPDRAAAEEIVRLRKLITQLDTALMRGPVLPDGTGTGEPRGIVNTPGVTVGPDLGEDGAQPTFQALKQIPAALRAIGEEQSFTIDLSGEAAYTPDSGTTWISAFQNLLRVWAHDIGLRRPQLFVVTTGRPAVTSLQKRAKGLSNEVVR